MKIRKKVYFFAGWNLHRISSYCWSSTTKQYTSFGPCTPTTSVFSISAVRLGPVARVSKEGRVSLYLSLTLVSPSLISYTNCEVKATHTCTGAYTLGIRPCCAELSKILPVLATRASQLVTAASQVAMSLCRVSGCKNDCSDS